MEDLIKSYEKYREMRSEKLHDFIEHLKELEREEKGGGFKLLKKTLQDGLITLEMYLDFEQQIKKPD